MAKISLIRLDSRLIHGQVITKWVKIAKANRIIIIDDDLAKDDFMVTIYAAAAPKGVSVEIESIDSATKRWEEEQLGEGNVMLLFGNVDSCVRMAERGLLMDKLQIGGLPSAPGRVTILRAVSMNERDMEQLKQLNQNGTEVYIHIIPEEPRMDFGKIVKTFEGR